MKRGIESSGMHLLVWAAALIVVHALPGASRALPLVAGDILVTNIRSDAVVHVDPVSGDQTVVSQGGLLQLPLDIAVEAGGSLLVTDLNVGGLLRIDPETGAQSLVASIPNAMGLAIGPSGDAFVSTHNGAGVFRVDPASGSVTQVASLGGRLYGIAVDASGAAFVVNPDDDNGIRRIDPETGALTRISLSTTVTNTCISRMTC